MKKLFFFVILFSMVLISLWLSVFAADAPTEEWIEIYNGPGNGDDYAQAIAADPEGNVYVTGYSDGNGTAYDYATVKYDQDGNQLWAMTYDGPANGRDIAEAIAVSPNGNVYVTGYSMGNGPGFDFVTIKYSR